MVAAYSLVMEHLTNAARSYFWGVSTTVRKLVECAMTLAAIVAAVALWWVHPNEHPFYAGTLIACAILFPFGAHLEQFKKLAEATEKAAQLEFRATTAEQKAAELSRFVFVSKTPSRVRQKFRAAISAIDRLTPEVQRIESLSHDLLSDTESKLWIVRAATARQSLDRWSNEMRLEITAHLSRIVGDLIEVDSCVMSDEKMSSKPELLVNSRGAFAALVGTRRRAITRLRDALTSELARLEKPNA